MLVNFKEYLLKENYNFVFICSDKIIVNCTNMWSAMKSRIPIVSYEMDPKSLVRQNEQIMCEVKNVWAHLDTETINMTN